jgi:NTP pyrophosphatase (non-canonical NTP hydrolase)
MRVLGFQDQVAEFVAEYDLETGVEARLLDLLSELGEVAKEILKGSQYGKAEFVPAPDWEEELADAFFSLICIANTTGVNLESTSDQVLQKNQARLDERGEAGSGRSSS